ncbi:hypothetical protein [Streptomyces sp. SID8499]|uniref:hypothetical protein n=1 Tax=Streptomyces sp. SID8499 TaxID=2706106 RepID=UPI0013C5A45F|nr:hypothetical protein [Streptomyces sp. SID8499]NED31128.1 hypothetical protein [Streptomyces sp. SID8499]
MPTADKYGQSIGLWQMTDAPSIPDAIAAIAAGVIPRAVLRFASASARGATLVGDYAPVDGMLTWLDDVKRLELRVSGAWSVVAVGNRAWTTIGLASGWSHNGNDNGDLQYRIVNLFGEDTIMFRGSIARTTWPTSVPQWWVLTSTPLPAAARPTTKRTFLVSCSDTNSDRIALKVDYGADGVISLWGTGASAKPPWVSFNGTFVSL